MLRQIRKLQITITLIIERITVQNSPDIAMLGGQA